MKCPSCGAEIGNERACVYCGARISAEMLREKELLNKAGCPKCGSTNVSFHRENQGEVRGKKGKKIIHYTVGVCKDCGYTWRADAEQQAKKRKTWLWVLGWIYCFPIPLTVLLLRKKDMKPALKYGIIAAAWAVVLIFFIAAAASPDKPDDPSSTTVPVSETQADEKTSSDETTTVDIGETGGREENVDLETHLYDQAQIRNVMNGFRTEKLGEYAVIYASSDACTQETVADLYFNYYTKHQFNWLTLIFSDKDDNSGIYMNDNMIIWNAMFEKDKYGDFSVLSSPNEEAFVPNDDEKTIKKIEFDN